MAGSLERITFTAFSDANFDSQFGEPFTAWINPASYTHDTDILYNDRQAQGSNGPSPEFNRIGNDSVAFDLMFDATGVIPPPIPGTPIPSDGVAGVIDRFKTLVATVNGDIHSPNYVKLSWAQLQYHCVLTRMNVSYTLFRPDGTPLRAKVSVTFLSYTSEQLLAKTVKKSSPDMTHMVTVTAGDTLPLLCHRIYGSSTYYVKVAAFNNLAGFRQLRPGTQLLFPPLSGSAP
jgi:nucleoid-associated protein YgaU